MNASEKSKQPGEVGSPGRPGLRTGRAGRDANLQLRPARRAGPTLMAATVEDGPAIAALLRVAGLPHEDFAAHLAHFFVVRDEAGVVVGAVGAEVYAPEALLRSLVVAPEKRGAGLGDELVRRLESVASAWGVERWWLLTTTAEEFFAARGFRVVARTEAPAAITATEEFRGLCPSMAVCMTRERREGP